MKIGLLFVGIFCWVNVFAQETASEKLHELFDEEWEFRSSLSASWSALMEAEEIPDVSPAYEQKKAKYWKDVLERLSKIDYEALSKEDKMNYRIFKFQLEDKVARIEFEDYLMPLNAEGGFYTRFDYNIGSVWLQEISQYELYLKNMTKVKKYMTDNIDLMRLGMEKGIVQPQAILVNYKALMQTVLEEDIEKHLFFKPFLDMPKSISNKAQKMLKEQAKTLIVDEVLPSFQAFDTFMEKEYVPNARQSLGATDLPNGKAYYEQRVQFFSTLPMSSDEIFELGKREVARIRADMEQVIEDLEFEGNFADFLTFLRTDEQFYAKTPREILMLASYLSKKMDGKLPVYFNTLPSLPYGVQPVPAAIAPNYTSGRYSGGSWKNNKPGNYWVNTYKLESRPLYALPALTLHEAVPGHHLQISLAQELTDLPNFRRFTYLSAYGEGWGLYSEYLGIEAAMYETPYEDFGRMTYEMWRACRLVVDVGLHAKGWTRQEAIDFMANNTALSIHEVTTEIDRYIGWPAQALSYKIGELKIRELRKRAEEKLGDKFNIREFHDVILKDGAVPLFILEELVDDYISATLNEE